MVHLLSLQHDSDVDEELQLGQDHLQSLLHYPSEVVELELNLDHLLSLHHDSYKDVELQLGLVQHLNIQHFPHEVVDLNLVWTIS